MHFATLLFPLALALTAAAEPVAAPNPLPHGVSPARQFRRSTSELSRRLDTPDIDPEIVCGKGYKDCGDGWCCTASQQCAGKLQNVPVCKDPTQTDGLLGGTAVAMPYKDLDEKLSSLSQALADATGGVPRAGGDSSPTGSSPAGSKETGAAAAVGMNGVGTMVGMVVGVWGVAALGGAGLLFL